MLAAQIAKRYARALFLSTRQRGLVDQADDQLTGLKAVLRKDPALMRFLASPRVEEEDKLAMLRSAFDARLEPLFVEFLGVLVKKRRAGYLIEIIEEFGRLVEFEKGIVRVTAISARPLAKNEEFALVARLARKTGKRIELEKRVDPDVIGGVIVIINDQIVDGSVRHGLDLLEEQLQRLKVH